MKSRTRCCLYALGQYWTLHQIDFPNALIRIMWEKSEWEWTVDKKKNIDINIVIAVFNIFRWLWQLIVVMQYKTIFRFFFNIACTFDLEYFRTISWLNIYTSNYTACVVFVSLLSTSVFFSFCNFCSMSLMDNSLILLGILQLSSPGDGLLLKFIACSIVSGSPSPVVSGRNTPKQPAIIAMTPMTKFGAGFQ